MTSILHAPGTPLDRRRGEGRGARSALGRVCTLVPLLVGTCVLGAWLLRAFVPTEASGLWLMKANTALCVVCTAAGMLLVLDERRDGAGHLRRALAAVVLGIGLATLLEYAAGIDLGLDQILVADPSPSYPGRMSPWTAATLVLLGLAVLAHRAPRLDGVADAALLAAGGALQMVVAGYLYGVVELYGIDRFTRVSPQTLACLVALWVALVAGRLGRGILAIATRRSAGGAAVRWLLPVALVLPPLLGWLRLLAQWNGLFTSTSVGVALFAVAQTLVLVALVYAFALRLEHAEARYANERRRRAELERLVAICAWTGKVRWNGEWVRVERYLGERFGVEVTHTISDDAMEEMEAEIAALERAEAAGG